jgi:hypothetical protein
MGRKYDEQFQIISAKVNLINNVPDFGFLRCTLA